MNPSPYISYAPGMQVPDAADSEAARRSSFSSCCSSDSFSTSSFYTAADASAFLVASPNTLRDLVQQLAAGTSTDRSAAARTLAGLCVDHINCFYTLRAGVVPQLAALLATPELCEETAYHACKVASALARSCSGPDLVRCHLPHALVMFLRYAMQQQRQVEREASEGAGGDDCSSDVSTDDDEPAVRPPIGAQQQQQEHAHQQKRADPHAHTAACGCPKVLLSTRVALHLSTALADLAFEQIGKRMIVQAGGVAPLLSIAGASPSLDCRTAALLALKRLAADEPCAKAMLQGGAKEQVGALVRQTGRAAVSPEGKDCALSLLSSLERQCSMLSVASDEASTE